VTLFEGDREVGGKLRQAIPMERLPREILDSEVDRIKQMGADIRVSQKIDKNTFDAMQTDYDVLVIASGAHNPVVIPFPGHERLVKGLEFLKAINNGENPKVGRKVVVIGAGNAGMDVALGAYAMGAEKVTAIDVQRPAAYQKEIDHFNALGGDIQWPVFTDRIDGNGLYTKDGRLIEADTVIISIGERPDLSYVPREWLTDRGMMDVSECWQSVRNEKVFAIGDTIKPGLLTNAIAGGREVAEYIDAYLSGWELVPKKKPEMIPQEMLSREIVHTAEPGTFPGHGCEERGAPLHLLRDLPRLLHVPGDLPGRGHRPHGKGRWYGGIHVRRKVLHRLRHLRRHLPLRRLVDGKHDPLTRSFSPCIHDKRRTGNDPPFIIT